MSSSGSRAERRSAGERIVADPPLRWAAPGLVRPGNPRPSRGRYLAWCDDHVPHPLVEVSQGGAALCRRRLPWPASAGRMFRIPSSLLSRVEPGRGEVRVRIR